MKTEDYIYLTDCDNFSNIDYCSELFNLENIEQILVLNNKQNYKDITGLDELKQETRNLGIENKVYFAGYCDSKKVQKMYKCADIAVFPSTYEPFGIVALEAMLAGVPTVVSDVGGLNEIVEHVLFGVMGEFLLQKRYSDMLEKRDLSAGIRLVVASQNSEQRGFAGAVRCDESDFVALIDVETDMLEKHFRSVTLAYIFYL